MKRDNQGINLLKAISCMAVVYMHCRFPGRFGAMISYILRFPVSIFFMVSGFYSIDKDNEWVWNKAKYLLKLIVLSEASYLLLNSIISFLNGKVARSYLLSALQGTTFVKAILFGPLFCGPLWYLYAAFWTWILVLGIRRICNRGEASVFVLIPVLLCIAILGRNYCSRYTDPEATVYVFRSALLYGLPFFLLGSFLNRYLGTREESCRKQALFVCVLGFVLIPVEYVIAPVIHDFQLSTIFISIGIFVFFVQMHNVSDCFNWLVYIGAKMSLWVYLSHVAFRTIVDEIAIVSNANQSVEFEWIRPMLVLLLTLAFSYVMSKVTLRKR